MTRVVILTGAELRHDYVRMVIAATPEVTVLCSYCEGVRGAPKVEVRGDGPDAELERSHFEARADSEREHFGAFISAREDRSNPVFLPRGGVNETHVLDEIAELGPDLLLAYGCSIVRDPLLGRYQGRLLNAHLGLSPYYRGSGTNFWPLVNGEPEFVGCTFMFMDAGIDTGEILHQIRARILLEDTPHTIGNRLIADMAGVYAQIAARFEELAKVPQPAPPASARLYRRRDFTAEAVRALHRQLDEGLIAHYLATAALRCRKAPLVANPALAAAGNAA